MNAIPSFFAPPVPLLKVSGLSHRFEGASDGRYALREASFELYPGEVLAIVGESGSGKSTLLNCLAGRLMPSAGELLYLDAEQRWRDVLALSERERRVLARTEWGFVEQHAAEGLRMDVSAGANIVERLMGQGQRHYGQLRETALQWMRRVELDASRADDAPRAFSGGMRQRLQIARNLVTHPRLVLMDEPTSGLDVSVQARLLDLIRLLSSRLQLSAIIVTHDLGVARLLAQRTLVMREGRIVEHGLTDRVLDDPQHPYTQLLVSSMVAP
ncbi:phosphonate C-P lyase system protein PhnK [Paucibacter sp. APW11]|uniref:Phosphonate C-P lyase system protein PhnK n=1 Tax=Roseateles aquae TaxID=3077235 RepID=A0ABU3PIA3_9BURK|nr:phosphonate C-P lyase system protein PhnK [Paucibacter sp. APW11]MDT9002267.1 phosphonate C-P lyase system protein PhnK [Paucibacter sp. APW11]